MEKYTAQEIMGIWNEAHPGNPCTENEAARYLKSHIFIKNLFSPKTIVRVMELRFRPTELEERNSAILAKNQEQSMLSYPRKGFPRRISCAFTC